MAIIITHLDGSPGWQKPIGFDDETDQITFGRSSEADVRYPNDGTCDMVGRMHFKLIRDASGFYKLERLDDYFVAIDGRPTERSQTVKSGSEIRLGRKKDGPLFKVEYKRPSLNGLADTGEQDPTPPAWRRELGVVVGIFLVGLVALIVMRVGDQLRLGGQIEEAIRKKEEEAKQKLAAQQSRLERAVYLILEKNLDGSELPIGTAWAFTPTQLATNAHVVKKIEEEWAKQPQPQILLRGVASSTDIPISEGNAKIHPLYDAFKRRLKKLGQDQKTQFKRLEVADGYDVGVLEIDPGMPLPEILDVASRAELLSLKSTNAVASAGFPERCQLGSVASVKHPEPQVKFGNISKLTDVFMSATSAPEHRLLVQHSIAATGGSSGSPIINANGKVIAILSGGQEIKAQLADAAGECVAPNAVHIFFGQRADLLNDIIAGAPQDQGDGREARIAAQRAYWERRAQEYDSYLNFELENLIAEANRGITGNEEQVFEKNESLRSGPLSFSRQAVNTQTFDAEPGWVYGFIAESANNTPIGTYLRVGGDELEGGCNYGSGFGEYLDPWAWVTVNERARLEIVIWSNSKQADYVLHGYRWRPTTASCAPSSEPDVSASSQ